MQKLVQFREALQIAAQRACLYGSFPDRLCRRHFQPIQKICRTAAAHKRHRCEKRNAVICGTADINQIDARTECQIDRIIGQFVHKVEGRFLCPGLCQTVKILRGKRTCDGGRQDQTNAAHLPQHLREQLQKPLCLARVQGSADPDRRHARIQERRAVRIARNELKRRIAIGKDLFPLNGGKLFGKLCGAHLGKRDYMRRGPQLHNAPNKLRRRPKGEIDEEIDRIPANERCRLLGRIPADLAEFYLLGKGFNISADSRVVGIYLIAQLIISGKERGEQITCPPHAEISGEISQTDLSAHMILRGVFFPMPGVRSLFLHCLFPSVRSDTL